MCPSNDPPAGLDPKSTPQFILITHDDATDTLASSAMRSVTDKHKNPNGCGIPATFFTLEVRLRNPLHDIPMSVVAPPWNQYLALLCRLPDTSTF